MKGNNLVILQGHLGADPEPHMFASGGWVAKLRVATNHIWRGDDGQKQERTDWHRVDVPGRTAEFCAKYLRKGDKVQILGTIRNRVVQEAQGASKTYTNIRAWEVSLLTPMGDRVSRPIPFGGEGTAVADEARPAEDPVVTAANKERELKDALPF